MTPTADVLSIERFPALSVGKTLHGFVGRVPGIDVDADRAEALARLEGAHRAARAALRIGERRLITAEQVHGSAVAVFTPEDELPRSALPEVDGLVTNRTDVCLGIYVADCCAVFLVDETKGVIALVHSGKKGTDSGIVPQAIGAMQRRFGCEADDLTAQLSPCIRPPWYETDFAAEIAAQCRAAGVRRVADDGVCTAANPERYYSYRREKGRTGRMLALLALA